MNTHEHFRSKHGKQGAGTGGVRHALQAARLRGRLTLLVAGYQGWFSCGTDGSDTGWLHRANNFPSPSDYFMKSWPDLREYPLVYQEGFANPGDGQPATLFSSYDQTTVNTHLRWMQENGLDTALVGFDRREAVTSPWLPDIAQWEAFQAARLTMLPNFLQANAARYRQ